MSDKWRTFRFALRLVSTKCARREIPPLILHPSYFILQNASSFAFGVDRLAEVASRPPSADKFAYQSRPSVPLFVRKANVPTPDSRVLLGLPYKRSPSRVQVGLWKAKSGHEEGGPDRGPVLRSPDL